MKFTFPLLICFLLFSSCEKPNEAFVDFQFQTSTPNSVGLRLDTLNKLITKIKEGYYGKVQSLLILKDDKLVVEEYFNAWAKDSLHNLFSVTKSFTSAAIGISIDKGYISGVDEKITNCFPMYPIENPSPFKDQVSLHHLLSMSSNYNWTYFYQSGLHILNSKNLIRELYNSPVTKQPGTSFAYTDLSDHLLSGVIYSKTGKLESDFMNEFLFRQIGISEWKWGKDPQGITEGASELYIKAIDLLKFAYLYLKKGELNKQQIISKNWVETSTQTKIDGFSDTYFCYSWQKYRLNHPVVSKYKGSDIFCARGRGGQFIWVCPNRNMVVVTNAMNDGTNFHSENMFWDYILGMTL